MFSGRAPSSQCHGISIGLAGLLTYANPIRLPICLQTVTICRFLDRVSQRHSQQRDCSGLSPDSLFISLLSLICEKRDTKPAQRYTLIYYATKKGHKKKRCPFSRKSNAPTISESIKVIFYFTYSAKSVKCMSPLRSSVSCIANAAGR